MYMSALQRGIHMYYYRLLTLLTEKKASKFKKILKLSFEKQISKM